MKHNKHPHAPSSNGKQNPESKKIEHRAYELYLGRGSDPGHDFDDWLQAECELKAEGKAAPGKLVL